MRIWNPPSWKVPALVADVCHRGRTPRTPLFGKNTDRQILLNMGVGGIPPSWRTSATGLGTSPGGGVKILKSRHTFKD